MESEISFRLSEYLKVYNKKIITLDELAALFGGEALYSDFAAAITELISLNILDPVKSAGLSSRTPRIPCKYRCNVGILREEYKCEIERTALVLHKSVNLEYYFSQPQSVWDADKEHIMKVDRYLRGNGLPEKFAGAPERSYQVFGDEKFIDEKNGKRLLQRLRLYDEMKISPGFDPAMFFINTKMYNDNSRVHTHLISENRTPFYVLSEVLKQSSLTTLIYGAGFNILSSIEVFENQIDLSGAKHKYLYFGDLDYTGISIWHYLSEKINAVPALFFYNEMLLREAAYGKEYQQPNITALNHFLEYFEPPGRERIGMILENGKYYPQEIFTKQELQDTFLECCGEGHDGA